MVVKYLTMVRQPQWLATLGRFHLHAQVETMSIFRAAPRHGQIDRLKRIYAYAIRTKDYQVRFRTDQPDYSFFQIKIFTGHILYMVVTMKFFLMTCKNHLVRL